MSLRSTSNSTWLDNLFFGTSSHVTVPGLLVQLRVEFTINKLFWGCELWSECPIDGGFYLYEGNCRTAYPVPKPSFVSRLVQRVRNLLIGEPIGLRANIEPIAHLVFERFNEIRHNDPPTIMKRAIKLCPGEGDAFDRAYEEQEAEYKARLDELILINIGKTIADFEFEEVYDFQSMPGRKELEREFEQRYKQLYAQWRIYLTKLREL